MIEIRDLRYGEIGECTRLVTKEWGDVAGDRAMQQMIEMFRMVPTQHPPHFYVAIANDRVIGFAGFKATMLMKNAYDLIWIVIAAEAQGLGLGKQLTNHRLDEIRRRDGRLVSLMTEKPDFFKQFGFRVVEVFDGWHLMCAQLGPVEI